MSYSLTEHKMEPRNYENGASGTAPTAPTTPSVGYPTGGDPQTGVPATKPGPFWFYKIGEALRNLITDAGLTPDDADLTQIVQAVNKNATEVKVGSAEIATQAETDAGTDDSRIVTPKKMRFGVSYSLTQNGYIVFPSWLGGFIVQWGFDDFSLGTITLPIVFPNAILGAGGIDNTAAFLEGIDISLSTTSVLTVYTTSTTNDYANYIVIGY